MAHRHRRILLAAAVLPTALAISSVPVGPSPAGAAGVAGDLFFSEYIEGSSLNKALEIYNSTGAAVNLGTGLYNVQVYFNGSATAGLTINLTGTVADGDVFVLAQTTADAAILAQADQLSSASWYNGDDAVVLRKNTTVLDVIGQIGADPGTEWGTGDTSTADNTLVRKTSICGGDTNGGNSFDPSIEWNGFTNNTFSNLGSHTGCEDAAPAVNTVNPVVGQMAVSPAANVVVTFDEAVTAAAGAFTINCSTTGAHTLVVTGGPTTFTLDPDVDFGGAEECTVTVESTLVTDNDAVDPPNEMAADYSYSFSTNGCADPATLIHDVQGSGSASPIAGSVVEIEGVVVGDYQAAGSFGGFYVQEEDADADGDPATSEGIFVFTSLPANVGEIVRVRGTVFEFNSSGTTLTELTDVTAILVCGGGGSVTPSTVTLPVASVNDWEAYEGMVVDIDQTLTVTETFTLARFGEAVLSVNGRQYQPTNVVAPGAPALAMQDLNNRSRIVLDDGNNQQNIDPTLYPAGGLSASNTLRSGDTLPTGVTGVLDQRFALYRLQPIGPIAFTATNPRPATPAAVGGTVKVASFNVLNYFNGNGMGGGFPTSRGAESVTELNRQRAKTVSAIVGLDADIVGLMELENDVTAGAPYGAIEDLVDGLNAATAPGTYAFIETGVIGTDEIRVGILYRPAAVTPVGPWDTLTTADDPLFIDTLNRPALAQTFEDALGGRFTVVVNHLKSKGSDCNAVSDPDTGDGQGNCNVTRTNAVLAMIDWMNGDPTGSGDPDFLVIGDLNSYAKEDPIAAFDAAGWSDMIAAFGGPSAYGYVFGGQSGYLDHAIANPSFAGQITGVTEWHINADEPIALDYNTNFKSANHINTLYAPDAFRSSDHDPVLVGVVLNVAPTVDAGGPYTVAENATVMLTATGSDPNVGDTLTYEWDLDGDTVFETPGQSVPFSAAGLQAPSTYTVTVRVSDQLGLTAEDTATVTVVYPFRGLFGPNGRFIDNTQAGRTIPVSFGLGGPQGAFPLIRARVQQVNCTTHAPMGTAKTIFTQYVNKLTYRPAVDLYTFNWQTNRTWGGTCQLVTVELTDNTIRGTVFEFRKRQQMPGASAVAASSFTTTLVPKAVTNPATKTATKAKMPTRH